MESRLTITDFVLPIAVCVSAGMFGAAGYFVAIKILERIWILPSSKLRGRDGRQDPSKYIGGEQ